jgi:uncharacterized glyoxalase superfamily protein PhnB
MDAGGGGFMSNAPTKTAERARFRSVNPHFVVRDVVEAAEYYRDVFGFKILGYFWDPPVFAMVGRDDVVIQFGRIDHGQNVAPNRARRDEALDAYIWVDDVDALYAELKGKGAKIVEEPKHQVWNCYEFAVEDASGFRLVFSKSAPAG